MAHIKENRVGQHSHVLWSGWHLLGTVVSLPWFQVFLAASLLNVFQWTNTSDFVYEIQYGHSRYLKWQLYWAPFLAIISEVFQVSPQARSPITTFLFACGSYVLIHVISKTMSSDTSVWISSFKGKKTKPHTHTNPQHQTKTNQKKPQTHTKTITGHTSEKLQYATFFWPHGEIPFCHKTSAYYAIPELHQINF